MEFDRKTVAELVLSGGVLLAFIAAAMVASQAFAAQPTVSGDLDGTLSGEVTDAGSGAFTGEVSGTVNGHLNGTVSGDVAGTVTGDLSGSFSAPANGTVVGTLPAEGETFSGNVTGHLLSGTGPNATVVGNFSGTVTGDVTSDAAISPSVLPTGGLAFIAVVGAFILLMGAVGLWMYRANYD
jgi:hypothetical protein